MAGQCTLSTLTSPKKKKIVYILEILFFKNFFRKRVCKSTNKQNSRFQSQYLSFTALKTRCAYKYHSILRNKLFFFPPPPPNSPPHRLKLKNDLCWWVFKTLASNFHYQNEFLFYWNTNWFSTAITRKAFNFLSHLQR